LLLMLVTHAVAATLERLLCVTRADAEGARDISGLLAVTALASLGAVPLWLGPAAELVQHFDVALIDQVIAISPLTHLAVASGNDLLHNPWFYQHSNLAGLRYSYPNLSTVTAVYTTLALTLLIAPVIIRRVRRMSHATAKYTRGSMPT